MCTAINMTEKPHLFGRTLDLEYSLDEQVVITPRRFVFDFVHAGKIHEHYALLGAAHISGGTPLYYDGMNEKGLCAAALRLPAVTVYHEKKSKARNLASFELIPYVLCNFASAAEAKSALKSANITPESFSGELSATSLHWLIGDAKESFVVESTKDGLQIYDNAHGALTNAPDFPTMCAAFEKSGEPLLGDLSSVSRFARIINAKSNTLPHEKKSDSVTRFFHILGTVNQPAGLYRSDERQLRTVYTSCMDTSKLTYYFTTYDCRKIRAVKMKNAYLDLDSLSSFPMQRKEWVHYLN